MRKVHATVDIQQDKRKCDSNNADTGVFAWNQSEQKADVLFKFVYPDRQEHGTN